MRRYHRGVLQVNPLAYISEIPESVRELAGAIADVAHEIKLLRLHLGG